MEIPAGLTQSAFSELIGCRLQRLDTGVAEVALALEPHLRNRGQKLHGGAIFSLVDIAMGLACSASHGFDQQSVTIECKINYMRAVSDGEVLCTARVLHAGGELYSLVKPQFEVGRAKVGKGGIVREEADRLAASGIPCCPALTFTANIVDWGHIAGCSQARIDRFRRDPHRHHADAHHSHRHDADRDDPQGGDPHRQQFGLVAAVSHSGFSGRTAGTRPFVGAKFSVPSGRTSAGRFAIGQSATDCDSSGMAALRARPLFVGEGTTILPATRFCGDRQ